MSSDSKMLPTARPTTDLVRYVKQALPGETKFARVNGYSIGYKAYGEGPLLVMCHGGEADHRMFYPVVLPLSRWFRVCVYDQRDCGSTTGGNG